MKSITFAEVANYLQINDTKVDAMITNVIIDSRKCQKGSLFFALPGEKVDGHEFVDDILHNEGFAVVNWNYPTSDSRILKVKDPLQALQTLAKAYLANFDIPIVAITGSNGKTTTKDMVASILKQRFSVHSTQGNFNNEIGLPLTVLSLQEHHDVLVLEMGMRGKGQIKALTEIAPPSIGVITNIGPVHLELLGTIDNIAEAKAELLDGLTNSGAAVLNGDDLIAKFADRVISGKIIFFGKSNTNDLFGLNIQLDELGNANFICRFNEKKHAVQLSIPGLHNVYNALAAIGVGLLLDIPFAECCSALQTSEYTSMRMQRHLLQDQITVINDAYNASPASMKAALETLEVMDSPNKVAVIGDMLELGIITEQEHINIGKFAASRVDVLIVTGDYRELIAQGALAKGFPEENLFLCRTIPGIINLLPKIIVANSIILVKASRSVALEKVVEAIEERLGTK